MISPAARHRDAVLDALAQVLEVLEANETRIDLIRARAQQLQAGRSQGTPYAELIAGSDGPLVTELITELLDELFEAGGRLRRAVASTLRAEGLSMQKISRLLRVSRQRVSALIRVSDDAIGQDGRVRQD